MMEQQEMEGGLEVMEADLAETENSIYHLVRSNVELAQFLNEAPGDEDLEQAIEENKAVLVRRRHRVKTLRLAISDLKTQRPHMATAAAPSSSARIAASASGPRDAQSMARHNGTSSESADRTAYPTVVSGAGGSGDAISTMTASMSLDAAPPIPPAGSSIVAGNSQASDKTPETGGSDQVSAAAPDTGGGGRDEGGVLL
ncbi:unnamed protein product [Ectocarpus sp. 12 AP-2014]